MEMILAMVCVFMLANADTAAKSDPHVIEELLQHHPDKNIQRKAENWQAITKMRTWEDASGQYSVEARYIDYDGASLSVTLETQDGRRFVVPLKKLSKTDRRSIASLCEMRRLAQSNPSTSKSPKSPQGAKVAKSKSRSAQRGKDASTGGSGGTARLAASLLRDMQPGGRGVIGTDTDGDRVQIGGQRRSDSWGGDDYNGNPWTQKLPPGHF